MSSTPAPPPTSYVEEPRISQPAFDEEGNPSIDRGPVTTQAEPEPVQKGVMALAVLFIVLLILDTLTS